MLNLELCCSSTKNDHVLDELYPNWFNLLRISERVML